MSDGTKADDIALALEEAIVSGEIPPGSVLRQEHLSEQFQVSRTPVREALRRLAALGLVTFEPNRGVRVRMLARDELREAFLVRAELESLATEIATPKMSDRRPRRARGGGAPLQRRTHELVEMSHAGRQDLQLAREWLHANHAFHDVIYAAAEVPAHRADGEGRPSDVPREAVWATGADLDELYQQERPPAPRDPRGDRGAQPAGRARARARARSLVGATPRGDPRQGLRADARRCTGRASRAYSL